VIDLLLGGVVPYLVGIVTLLVAALGLYLRGRSDNKKDVEREQTSDYMNKRKEIDNADLGIGSTDDDRIKRLHDLAGGKRGGGS